MAASIRRLCLWLVGGPGCAIGPSLFRRCSAGNLTAMANIKRLPDYVTVIGEGTEIAGVVRFAGGMHIDGKVIGDVIGVSENGCALTLGRTGVIEGDLDVARVVLDGAVIGNVRAAQRAELAPGACIEGSLCYGVLEMAEGAEVNGKLLRTDEAPADPAGNSTRVLAVDEADAAKDLAQGDGNT